MSDALSMDKVTVATDPHMQLFIYYIYIYIYIYIIYILLYKGLLQPYVLRGLDNNRDSLINMLIIIICNRTLHVTIPSQFITTWSRWLMREAAPVKVLPEPLVKPPPVPPPLPPYLSFT